LANPEEVLAGHYDPCSVVYGGGHTDILNP